MRFVREFLVPLLVPVLVGLGSSAVASVMYFARLESRIEQNEGRAERHEALVDRELLRHEALLAKVSGSLEEETRRLLEHETRISRIEAQNAAMQSLLEEVRADVKRLLARGGR